MNVIFIEPSFPYNQREFVRALNATGANVIGIGERPADSLGAEMRGWLGDYLQVHSVVHEPSLLQAVMAVQDKLWVDRLEATVEAHIMAAANVRRLTGIPGTSPETAWLCRDKPAMKEALRRAGITGERYSQLEKAMRALRRRAPDVPELVIVAATDPLNLVGITSSGPRVSSQVGSKILYRSGVPIACLEAGELRMLTPLEDGARVDGELRYHAPPHAAFMQQQELLPLN